VDRPELTIDCDAPVAFVDVETTGGSSAVHRVIEVAVVGATGGEREFEWRTFVNSGVHIPAAIQALTGIDDDAVADAPPFEKIAAQLLERLAGRLFVAHNARFDYGFLRRELARAGIDWRSRSLCTVRLSRALYPEMPRHNLDAVIEYHGLVVPARHRALPDADALWQFWREMRAAWPRADLQRAIDFAACTPEVPAALPADLPDDLPEECGVYRLHGRRDDGAETLLYVGKANNLRERVLDHFRGTDAKSRRLAEQVRRVSWTRTAGELGALLLEAREVRERQPEYNKQLRGGAVRHTWWFAPSAAPRLVPLDAAILRSGDAYGTWRSEREARRALESLAREHRWCFKVLGLETGPGSCFGMQVGRCDGPCVGHEPAAAHLARVRIGLARLRLPQWPHGGPVVVCEGRDEQRQYHVIDAWQHLATFDGDEAANDLAEFANGARRARSEFAVDDFHILKRALVRRRVVPLPAPPQDPWG
jgi:DNA polymerase III subunit epsilon